MLPTLSSTVAPEPAMTTSGAREDQVGIIIIALHWKLAYKGDIDFCEFEIWSVLRM